MLTETPSILLVKGTDKEGLTVTGKELALQYVADYAHSLANSSRSYAT